MTPQEELKIEELNEIRCVRCVGEGGCRSKRFLTRRPSPQYARIAIVDLDNNQVILDDGNNWYEIRNALDADVIELYDFCRSVLK